MRTPGTISLCVAMTAMALAGGRTEAQVPTKLLRWVPADANAVVVLDVDALFHSPLATRENWRKKAADQFANQEFNVPPEAQPVYQSYSYGAGRVGPYGSYGGYSFSGSVRVAADRAQIRIEEHANAAQVKNSEMKQIEDGMAQIRRAMTERYNAEF